MSISNMQVGHLHKKYQDFLATRARRQVKRTAKRARLQGPNNHQKRQRHKSPETVRVFGLFETQ